ncbi:MAG: (5-formylfuran-3-yl)methyl phosphate synthase [Gemmatimonadota bacterium]
MKDFLHLLISIRAVEEIAPALAGGAMVLDVKTPALGSLGCADRDVVRAACAAAPADVPVSAALGDRLREGPDGAAELRRAAEALARAGAGILKVGLAGTSRAAALDDLSGLRQELARGRPEGAPSIVAVAFADAGPRDVSAGDLPDLALAAGIEGAMLDTLDKGRSVLELLGGAALRSWAEAVKRRGLLCGLAGALRLEELAKVSRLGCDVIGLRGAVCTGGRGGSVSADLVARARDLCRVETEGFAWK